MADLNQTRPERGRGERGAELIELALVLPILLFVFAAIVDFAFLFQRYETMTNAAREGARLASLPNYTQTDVETRIQNYLAASGLTGAPTPYVNMNAGRTLPSGLTLKVAEIVVFYPAGLTYLGPVASLVGGSGYGSMMLRASSVMRIEGGGGS